MELIDVMFYSSFSVGLNGTAHRKNEGCFCGFDAMRMAVSFSLNFRREKKIETRLMIP